MKKKSVIWLMAAVIGCTSIFTGCSLNIPFANTDNSNDEDDDNKKEDNKKDDNEDDGDGDWGEIVELDGDGEGYEYVTTPPSDFYDVDEELRLIYSLREEWLPTDPNYSHMATVTDWDADGLLEVTIVSSVNAAASDVRIAVYEVDESITGLVKWSVDFEYAESMPALEMLELIPCAVNKAGDYVYGYSVQDSLYYGNGSGIDREFILTVEDNGLYFDKVAYGVFKDYSDESGADYLAEDYFDASGNEITYDEYSAAITEVFEMWDTDYVQEYQHFYYFTANENVTEDKLRDSFDGLVRYSSWNEYYNRFDSATSDEYPEGWIPENYSGEQRYSALGSLSMQDTTQGILDEFLWRAVEVHDSENIYLYDYRDEIGRLDSCYMVFDMEGDGTYCDGYGEYISFNYELYSTEICTNVSISFEDGSYAFAFSYCLYLEGEEVPRNCLVVSFENEELYFIQSAE